MALLSAITKAVDELVQFGYPREVAERIASGDLPMDTASRMQRAEAMGFDPSDVQYHGTKADFTEFAPSEFGNVGPGIYMSTNPEVASGYATRNLYNPEEGAQVMPLLTRGETIGMRDYFAQYPDTAISQMPDTNAELRELGITAINEAAGAPDKAVFDPRDVRSLFSAAFDPEYKGSNILGERAIPVAGAGLLAAAAMSPEEAEAGVLSNLIKAGYPEEVAQRIASGELPMDYASRMERAVEQGFDPQVFYHGTNRNILNFDRGLSKSEGDAIFASDMPFVAKGYAQGEGANLMPLLIKSDFVERGKPIPENFDEMSEDQQFAFLDKVDRFNDRIDRSDYVDRAIAGAGGKDVVIRNLVDPAYYDPLFNDPSDIAAIVNPQNIRSRLSAAFDPEYKGSNILGGTAAGALGLTALMAPEEAEAGVIKTFGREFDPRFDKRAKEQEKLRDTTFTIEERGTQDAPRIPLADLEGRPFVTTMSDRTQAGGLLTGIDDVALDRPINLQGGQGFMFENPGMVWASAPGVVNQIMRAASEVGDNPVYLPFRMAPTGGDFATMTGETMLSFASSNMNKTQKKALDQAIKDYESVGSMVKGKRVGAGLKIKDWKGVDDPSSVEVWRNTPDTLRKELMNMMDVQFRDKGGLSVGQARLAVTEPGQADALDAQIQNIGEIFTGKDVVQASGHPSYPAGVPGQGLGRTDQEVGIFELLTDARFGGQQKPVGDPQKPTAQEIRALQMKPYTGRITEDILRGLETRGVNINANPMVTAAAVAAGQEAEGLLAQLPQKDLEAYNYSDVLPVKRSKDPEEREGLLGGYSPAYTGIVEDMVEGLLKFSTQAKRGIYNPTAATEFLL